MLPIFCKGTKSKPPWIAFIVATFISRSFIILYLNCHIHVHTTSLTLPCWGNCLSTHRLSLPQVIQMFRGCKPEDMPPHIYATAQIAYRNLLNSRRNQSVVFLGRSGAGKTTNLRHLLHYYMVAAGAANKILTGLNSGYHGQFLEKS